MKSVGETLRSAFPVTCVMGEAEIIIRAREAWVASHSWAPRWLLRRVRAGRHDGRLHSIITVLRDMARPLALIVADRDEATAAVVMRSSPGLADLTHDQKLAVVSALHTAVRMGRRG